jgi:hypothetical protein
MAKKASLQSRLRADLLAGKDLSKELNFSDSRPLRLADAVELCAFLAEQTDVHRLIDTSQHGEYDTPLYHLVMPFQQDVDDQTREHLREHGLPELLRLCDLALAEPNPPGHPLVMIAKMFALYGYEPGVERVAVIARRFPDEYMLSVSFNLFASEDHPHGSALAELLREPLPGGFAAVLTLDLANTLCRQQRLRDHPFDTPAGHRMLELWLTDPDPDKHSYAVSAAAGLPFLGKSVRNRLAALAMDHPDTGVQMEAAWASAYRGSEAGLKFLARLCADPRSSQTAQQYLEELGRSDAIPRTAKDPDFRAMAEMCNWLSHPNEFGRSPDEIALYDTRELFWPPTDDSRRLWLFRYRYAKRDDAEEDQAGVGMVGSITFALFGEATAQLCPEDVYGLHCCWELEMNEDPRAPKKRTARAGRKLLGI